MNLLIINEDAVYIKKKIGSKFPELTIHAAADESEVGNFVEKADILLATRTSDEIIKRAKKLEWIQSMITGVDYYLNLPSLRKETLLTSTRGIHGPQMSELAILLMLSLNRKFPENIRNQDKKNWGDGQESSYGKRKWGSLVWVSLERQSLRSARPSE